MSHAASGRHARFGDLALKAAAMPLPAKVALKDPAAFTLIGQPHLPRDLEVICLTCLAKTPSARYHSASEFAEDLQRWLEHRPILARPISTFERAWHWARVHQSLAILSATTLL